MDAVHTNVLKIDATNPEREKVEAAAGAIRAGGLVVFPTETVYGIGANAFDEKACAGIYRAKGRPSDNPLIVTTHSLESAMELGDIPREYSTALKRIWPCPITIIVKAKAKFPHVVTAGLDTVAIRVPAHPVALSLIEAAGVPIAAPSANPSGKPTATTGRQAVSYFMDKADCIIDSGDAFFGVESTIIDLSTFTILRPGPFTPEEIEQAFGKKPRIGGVAKGKEAVEVAVSPGTKYVHYAPDTQLFMFKGDADALADILAEGSGLPDPVFIGCSQSCKTITELGYSTIALGDGANLYDIARNLYKSLILLDSFKVKFGVIEAFPEEGIGLAIMNRIRKAASHKEFFDLDGLEALLAERKV